MTTSPLSATTSITEEDIAQFLLQTPEFFERHADVLAAVQINSPHRTRAISLQERQAEMLRDKIKGLEQRLLDMVRHSETLEAMTLYRALYGARGLWVRPAAMFGESVEIDGQRQPRFTRLGDYSPEAQRAARE